MDPVTILFFADSHLGFDQPVASQSKKVRRGPDFFRNYHHILTTARQTAVDLVIHGGDLFHRSTVHPRIVNQAYDALFNLADKGVPVVLVPGNHDRSTLPTSLFLQHPNIFIFREPEVFHLQLKELTFDLFGFPFIRDIGNEITPILENFKAEACSGSVSLLCMHQAVEGAKVGPSDYTFRPGSKVIRMSDLHGHYHAYLSGHIHPHQILWTEQSQPRPLIYPGSIERTSFAEQKEIKGYSLLTFHKIEAPKIVFKELPSRPMHILTLPNQMIDRMGLQELMKSKIKSLSSNSVLRVDSPTEQLSKWLQEKEMRHLISDNIIYQIRHLWLPQAQSGKYWGNMSKAEQRRWK